MNLKYFSVLVSLVIGLSFIACNSSNEYTTTDLSSDGQVKSFSVDAVPYTSIDSITYPYLASTKFTVQSKGTHVIFNKDSLPQHTDIRTLFVNMKYSIGTPAGIKLIYKDSIPEEYWNSTDSVKFIKDGDDYYPRFRIYAYDGTERTYQVNFRIHKQDPDSIRWTKVAGFNLPANGESQVFSNASKDKFTAFIKNGGAVKLYTSPVNQPAWSSAGNTNLPSTAIVRSMQQIGDYYVALDSQGNIYTSAVSSGLSWNKAGLTNIISLVGQLPEVDGRSSKNELLFIYKDNSDSKLKYAKTSDFNTSELVKISTRGDNNEVISTFPIKDFSSFNFSTGGVNALMVVGGVDEEDNLIRKSWRISNVAPSSGESKAEISIFPGNTIHVFPEEDAVTSFLYDNQVYAMSTDSLSLYNSSTGSTWKLASEKQKLHKDMASMGRANVVVDSENYIWVFGGVSKEGVYSQQVWRGRLNRLTFKE